MPQVEIVSVSAFVVGVQATQATAVQGSVSVGEPRRQALLLAAAGILLLLSAAAAGPALSAILATGGGGVLGLISGSRSVIMLTRGRIAYQRFIALRSIGLFAALVVASAMPHSVSRLVFLIAAWALLAANGRSAASGTSPQRRVGQTLTALGGAGASLFYRSDVTWVRSAAVGDPLFKRIHVMLILVAALQAVGGMGVVHVLFADRQRWKSNIARNSRSASIGALAATAIGAIFVATYAGLSHTKLAVAWPIVMGGVIVLVLLNTFTSGLCHVVGWSWVPYTAGVVGCGGLLLALGLGVPIVLVYVAELTVIQTVLSAGLLVAARRMREEIDNVPISVS